MDNTDKAILLLYALLKGATAGGLSVRAEKEVFEKIAGHLGRLNTDQLEALKARIGRILMS